MKKACVLFFVFLLCSAIHAAQFTLPIQTDTYMDSLSPATNYGASGSVKVLISTDGSACRGLFQLPPGVAVCDTARLAKIDVVFYVFNNLTSGRNITLYPLTRPFVEGTSNGDGATWNTCDGTNAWTTAGGDFDTNYPVIGVRGTNGFFRWNITALLTNEAARTLLLTNGALLQIDETPLPPSGTPRAPFTSSGGAAAERPYVDVTMAAPVAFPITNDTCVDSRAENINMNYGAATTVKAVVNNNVTSDGSVCRGLFELPSEIGLYAIDQIARATVVFYVWQDNTAERNVTLFPLARSFVEGNGNGTAPPDGATWQTCDGLNAWTNAGGDFDTNYPVIGVKGPIMDEVNHGRYFSWDITPLLTNEPSRMELMNYGALLQIDEIPLPPSGMPRAPFTSSDGAVKERPYMQVLIIPRTAGVSQVSIEEDALLFNFDNCTPYVTNRIERTYDMQQPDGWTLVTNLVTSESDAHWMEPLRSEESNAFYRIISDE